MLAAPALYRVENFYPTPRPLVDQLIEGIDIRPDDVLLEPSAGKGNIADVLKARCPLNDVRVIEQHPTLRWLLRCKGHNVVDTDFFTYTEPVDVIVQNPPFCNNFQDIDHFRHAWNLLKPGGRIASVLHAYSAFPRLGYGKPARFAEWLDEIGAEKELIRGAFAQAERRTDTDVALVWATKEDICTPAA